MKHLAILATFVLTAVLMPAYAGAQSPTMCTMQYDPVCGTENGTYKTYGNGCVLGAEGATYQHQGECTKAELDGRQEGTYTPPAHCTAWFDGCNRCSRSAGGQSMCTLMACMGEPRTGYCTVYSETEAEEEPATVPEISEGNAGPEASPAEAETDVSAATSTENDIGFFFTLWNKIRAWFGGLF